mmetsp:Transcript_27620/g.89183  ORF Transcript_27620/g.89183 Transcript_27620/m.89183 type:complete len:347 (-) Transcript_27620:41-1081(-)
MVAGTVPNLENKLFVGGCPPTSGEEELRQIFEKHGAVEEVFIMRGGSRSGMACAFIRYAAQEMAQQAIDAIHGNITLPDATEPLVVRWADTPGSRGREARGGRHGAPGKRSPSLGGADRRGAGAGGSYGVGMGSMLMQPNAYAYTPAYVPVPAPVQMGTYGQVYTQMGMGGYNTGGAYPAQAQVGYGYGYGYAPQSPQLGSQVGGGQQQQQVQLLYAQQAQAYAQQMSHGQVTMQQPQMMSPGGWSSRMMAMPVQQYGVQGYGMQPYQLPHAQALSQEGQPRVPRGYGRQQEHGGSQQHHQQRPRCGGSQSRAQQSAGDSKARPASQPAPALTADEPESSEAASAD